MKRRHKERNILIVERTSYINVQRSDMQIHNFRRMIWMIRPMKRHFPGISSVSCTLLVYKNVVHPVSMLRDFFPCSVTKWMCHILEYISTAAHLFECILFSESLVIRKYSIHINSSPMSWKCLYSGLSEKHLLAQWPAYGFQTQRSDDSRGKIYASLRSTWLKERGWGQCQIQRNIHYISKQCSHGFLL